MKQTISFQIPEGKTYIQTEDEEGNILIKFVDIEEPVRSKSWEEFCKNHPKVDKEYYIDSKGDLDHTIIRCPNNLASKEDAEGILALIQLTRLHDEWVGGWKPDSSFKKYQIISDGISICVTWHYNEHRILDFPTEEMAKEFLGCFKDLIEKAKRFL